jgi:hypothetical protein
MHQKQPPARIVLAADALCAKSIKIKIMMIRFVPFIVAPINYWEVTFYRFDSICRAGFSGINNTKCEFSTIDA